MKINKKINNKIEKEVFKLKKQYSWSDNIIRTAVTKAIMNIELWNRTKIEQLSKLK